MSSRNTTTMPSTEAGYDIRNFLNLPTDILAMIIVFAILAIAAIINCAILVAFKGRRWMRNRYHDMYDCCCPRRRYYRARDDFVLYVY
ncbi:hypothetical protein TrispH2_001984 [Trichoplax sp. H2]|nr:hypothetical protein TrispH2_001984 [Trichoplax sp. H2]|eukprot:RDD46458.1 hypothetical protein TrispH2_001984 [Trichoplax sp. H2]